MEGFSSPVASHGTFTSIANADDGGSSSGSEINELAQAMSTVHIRRRGRYESGMQCTPQSAIRPRKRIDVSEGMDEGKDEDKENVPAEPSQDENKHVTTPKATPSRLDRITQLREELTCSVCLEVCTRPCTTPCGHSFCRRCLRASLAHSSKCAKCREALPQGYLPKINTALWNTIQLLFPSEAAAGPPVTPNPEAPLQPSQRPNTSGLRLNSQGGRPPINRASTGRPILSNPFRPPWQNRQQINAPTRVQRAASQAAQLNNMAGNDNNNSNIRSSSTGGHGSRLAELLGQVEGVSDGEPQGNSQEGASSRGSGPASAQVPLGHHPLQQSTQTSHQAEANQGSGRSRRVPGSHWPQQQRRPQQQQQQRPRQRLPGAPGLHLLSAQRDQPQEEQHEHRLQQRQRWQQWQQLQRARDQSAAADITERAAAQATDVTDSGGNSTATQGQNPAAPEHDAHAPAVLNPFVRSTHHTHHHTMQPHNASATNNTSAGSHRAAAAAAAAALPPPPPPEPHQQHPLSQHLCGQLLRPPRSPESPPYASDPRYFSSAPVHHAAAGIFGDSTARASLALCPQQNFPWLSQPSGQQGRRRVQHGDEEVMGGAEGAEAAQYDWVGGANGQSGDRSSSGSDDADGLASASNQGHAGEGVGVAHALGLRLGLSVEQDMRPAPPGSRSNPIEIVSSDSDDDEEEQGCPAEHDQHTQAAQQQAAAAAAPAAPMQAQGAWVVPGLRRPASSSRNTASASAAIRPMGATRSTQARSTLVSRGAASVPGLRRPRPRDQD